MLLGVLAACGEGPPADTPTPPTRPSYGAEIDALLDRFSDPKDGLQASNELVEHGQDAMPAVVWMLEHGNAVERLYAVLTAGGIGPDAAAAVPGLIAELGSDHVETRALAAGLQAGNSE